MDNWMIDDITITVKFTSGIWVVGKYWGFHLRVFQFGCVFEILH